VSEYGITPTGCVIKRLDVIADEIHADLTEQWGFNTRQNPQSLINVLVMNFADRVAELWEFGQDIYDSMYPFSAEGLSLDNAVQYGGIAREEARPTIYPIHCECVDGTIIPKGTRIRTTTNPAIELFASAGATVTRSAFNQAKIRVAIVNPNEIYTVALDGDLYQFMSGASPTDEEILTGLAGAITNDAFTVTAAGGLLLLNSSNVQQVHVLVLGNNLTTESVTGIVNFSSEQNGEIVAPNNTVTQIVTSVPGLISVVNRIPYIAGRLLQTDAELRKSYADKIFIRSNRMLESIKSAILRNVQGVTSVTGYQNDTNMTDEYGRWPHCVEMVVEGGSDFEIAMQIWDKKAAGINTFGSLEVVVPGDEGEPVTIRFNRPERVYVWFQVAIYMNPSEILPPNYSEAIKEIIVGAMSGQDVSPGTQVIPQRLIEGRIYEDVPGIGRIDTRTYHSTDPNQLPGTFDTGIVPISPRQKAVTDETRIAVILSG
jgi:uncharacterized phage protein gp47/JayE